MRFRNPFGIVKSSDEIITWRKPFEEQWPPQVINRSMNTPSIIILKNGLESYSTCLKCKPASCVCYQANEIMSHRTDVPDAYPTRVCPTDALSINQDGYPEADMEKCIFCNLCVIRCPVGALYWSDNRLVVIKSQDYVEDKRGSKEQAEVETLKWKTQLKPNINLWNLELKYIVFMIGSFQNKVEELNLRSDCYYPLVRNYLRELGFKAYLGRQGDTQWRFDCITIEPFVMPIEIKAPSESKKITPDAARQAVENAAIVESRYGFATKGKSIVVGYQYPNKRSDVRESLINVHTSFDISVGLYTTGVLHYLLLRHLEYNFHPKDLEFLFDNTLGSCDEIPIVEFWANYMKWRIEIITFKERAPLYSELIFHLPYHKFPQELREVQLIDFWKKERELLSYLNELLFFTK